MRGTLGGSRSAAWLPERLQHPEVAPDQGSQSDPYRRLFAPSCRCSPPCGGAQIIHSAAGGLQSVPHAGAVCPHYVLPLGYEHYDGCITCPRCGQPASPPPGVCWTSRNSATTPPTARPPSARSAIRSSPGPVPASRACGSATPACTPCSPPCASSGFFPAASPTATCAPSWPSSSACPPSQ